MPAPVALRQPIVIRDLRIDPPLLLAPMVGLTHSALRQVICEFGGAGLLSTEMLSARSLPVENPAISPYLIRTASEKPLSYQLLISSADEVAPALDALHRMNADAIDLNLGCPAPMVARRGAGARLMDQPEDVRKIAAEARKLTSLPLTAKIRLGTQLDLPTLKDFCSMLEGEGIDLISVHARLKHESFARNPRWESIAGIKERVCIPVVANGGIFSVEDAEKCLRLSGADGLMLARGAAMRPWLFAEIARDLFGADVPEPVVSLPDLFFRFVDLVEENFRPEHRIGRLKQFTPYFAKNYQFGHQLFSRVQGSKSVEEARERAEKFFENNGGGRNAGS